MEKLQSIIKQYEEQGNTIPDSFKKVKEIKSSINKKVSMMGATEVRQKKAVKKISDVIEYMEREKKKMTYTAIAKYAEVSPITVKKYVTITDNQAITNKDFYYLSL